MQDRYLQPNQARRRAPTPYEDLLADAIERAFGEGAHSLPELIASLNRSGLVPEGAESWTEENFQHLMARLAD